MWTFETVALVAISFLLGGFVKGAVGLGLPVVVLAALAATLGLKTALALLLVPAVVSNIWQALAGPALGVLLRRMWSFLLAAVVGIWLGTAVLARADPALLEAALGGLLVAYSAVALITPQIPPPGERERWLSPLAGGLGGVVFGMTGLFIVPGILYLQTLGLKRDHFVQALGLTFVTISATLAVAMTGRDLVTLEQAAMSAAALVPTGLGLLLGTRLRHLVSEAGFRRLFFVALIGVGLYMLSGAAR